MSDEYKGKPGTIFVSRETKEQGIFDSQGKLRTIRELLEENERLQRELVQERERAAALDKQLVVEVTINNEQTRALKRLASQRVDGQLDRFQAKMDSTMADLCFERNERTCFDCRDGGSDRAITWRYRCWWCGLGTRIQFWLWRPRRE